MCWLGRLQSVAGTVGRGRWCPTIQRRKIHTIYPSWWQKVPFSWSGPPYLQPRLSRPCARMRSFPPPCLPMLLSLPIMLLNCACLSLSHSASFRCHLLQEASLNCQVGDIPPLHLVPQSSATVHLWPPTPCISLGQGGKFNQLYFQPQCLAWGRCSKYLWDVERCQLDV